MKMQSFEPALGPQPTSPNLYSPKETTLAMKEKLLSLSGDDFTVKTVDGLEVCKVKGKLLSAHHSKAFTDISGKELFTVKNKLIALNKSFHCESPGGHDIEVNGHFSIGTSKSSVHFKNAADGQKIELAVKGDWFDRSAAITVDGRPVAHIARSFFNFSQIFGDKQTYFVTVAPNVDLSLIAAICVCLDERENEK